MFTGRDTELRTIRDLLSGAGDGRGGAMVLAGQPGIGKSALLEAAEREGAAADAAGFRVLRATGYEAESGLSYAGLHLLLHPALGLLPQLPAPQRAALASAFGLSAQDAEEPTDRLLLGLAVLTLLSELAEPGGDPARGPVLCLVDDAHWLDLPSLEALVFAARRLGTERVAILFGTREGCTAIDRSGLPTIALKGLSDEAAGELLATREADLSHAARTGILAQAQGNPLALLELPAEAALGSASFALLGNESMPELPERLLQAFRVQVERMPRESQLLVKLAATADEPELELLVRAAPLFGVTAQAIGPAEQAGVLRVNQGTFSFRHPLMRTAILSATTVARRIDAHRALAAALTGPEDADRRIFHEAAAATSADEALAAELERTAERAARRSGRPAAIGAYERAAQLSPEPADRLRRWVLAAETAIDHGDAERAELCARNAESVLIDTGGSDAAAPESADPPRPERPLDSEDMAEGFQAALAAERERRVSDPEPGTGKIESARPDPGLRARLVLARAAARFELGDLVGAHRVAYRGAQRLGREGGPREAGWLLCQTVDLAWSLGDKEVAAYAELFMTLDVSPDEPIFAIGLYVESALLLSLRRELGFMPYQLGDVVAKARTVRADGVNAFITLGMLAMLAPMLAQDEAAEALLDELLADSREHGRMAWLTPGLSTLARTKAYLGKIPQARALSQEAEALAEAGDQKQYLGQVSGLAAYLAAIEGDEEACREHARRALTERAPSVMALGESWSLWALGLLELGLGRPGAALEHLRTLENGPAVHQLAGTRALPDLLEAAVRAGDREAAEAALDRLTRWAGGIRQDAADALVLRGEALLAADEESAVRGFTAALKLYEKSDRPFDRARTQLHLGERLRRGKRRTDARGPLGTALATFEQIGAGPWAERARQELAASGGPAPVAARAVVTPSNGPAAAAFAALTTQEAQIVRLAAQGLSNRDIAAQLILSPRTVGHHLYKAYPKLGVLSRGELPALLAKG